MYSETRAAKAVQFTSRLGKPTDVEARALSSLFPSCSQPGKRKTAAPTFDPSAECVALSAQKKKKAALGLGRPVKVKVVLLERSSVCVPRAKARKSLDERGRIQALQFRRNNTPQQVEA